MRGEFEGSVGSRLDRLLAAQADGHTSNALPLFVSNDTANVAGGNGAEAKLARGDIADADSDWLCRVTILRAGKPGRYPDLAGWSTDIRCGGSAQNIRAGLKVLEFEMAG